VYTANPKIRTANDLVETLFRERSAQGEDAQREPAALHKQVCASLTHDCGGELVLGEPNVLEQVARQVMDRLGGRDTVVCVMDGQRSLWDWVRTFFTFVHVVEILDLMHVVSRLWEAAHLFHREGSPAACAFVRARLLSLLQGNAGYMIGGLRQMATKRQLRGEKLKRLHAICNYLDNNRGRMHYDEYLAAGYPIASGVIEGACRYYVKDRMERAGMRWTVEGAQAMLGLRATYINGHWKEFQAYRIERETRRLYPQLEDIQDITWPFQEAA
jgi:hypothetical protein